MSSMQRVGDLEIEQDHDFQRRSWRLQRAGWIVLSLVLLAGLLGLFGSGPLAHATVGAPGCPVASRVRPVRPHRRPVHVDGPAAALDEATGRGDPPPGPGIHGPFPDRGRAADARSDGGRSRPFGLCVPGHRAGRARPGDVPPEARADRPADRTCAGGWRFVADLHPVRLPVAASRSTSTREQKGTPWARYCAPPPCMASSWCSSGSRDDARWRR